MAPVSIIFVGEFCVTIYSQEIRNHGPLREHHLLQRHDIHSAVA